ncbi:Crp/Fnr family transcriptional regulator [Pedobacter yulinensis]|uniref:Crp/Fnr family transcriptional regulator n=1 Tax=Pedobacter yulinensis TaxID=2126353 RepID=A0A2T3HJE2_9SPHI|nr:Crp/Fnr family transcriptional regulator [Pedobacter yulinensis]PST82568.1 Crp/Fnr family transcriptional regulator [Pedobacter yulinensis]
MAFDGILKNIARHADLTAGEQDLFCSVLQVKNLKKKELLFKPGKICQQEAYINKGCLRTFFCDKNGAQNTFYFGIEDWWISDLLSRTFKVPSQYHVEAIEDAQVFLINDEDLENLMMRIPKLEHFYRKLFQYSVATFEQRLLEAHQLSAEERYRKFRDKYPEFDRRIPQKHIASYLGMTPEFFNTIRSKVLKAH